MHASPLSDAAVTVGTVRRLYLQHLIANTESAKLREALESLATPEVRQRVQVDTNYLLDHPDEIVPYFTNRDADEVLLLVGNVLKGQKVDPYNLTPSQQNQIKTALETSKIDNWMARKYKKSKADRDEVRGRCCRTFTIKPALGWCWVNNGEPRQCPQTFC